MILTDNVWEAERIKGATTDVGALLAQPLGHTNLPYVLITTSERTRARYRTMGRFWKSCVRSMPSKTRCQCYSGGRTFGILFQESFLRSRTVHWPISMEEDGFLLLDLLAPSVRCYGSYSSVWCPAFKLRVPRPVSNWKTHATSSCHSSWLGSLRCL